jgi:hypothetical protein
MQIRKYYSTFRVILLKVKKELLNQAVYTSKAVNNN